MSWEQYRSVMERYAIKTDDMATEDAYFMATHMPFSQLEVYQGGRTSSAPKLMSEDEVFENLIYNPDNEHRMIIVRGNNGTGKSHLIRYLKAKFENSPATVYNPATEQLVFLRRLNNSIRGALNQLIEEKVIKDPGVEEKMRKFVASSDAKDEAAFRTDILFSYVAAVSNDQTGETYRPVICRDIASYLSDSRVREHLLREGGAISRCYNLITAPSNQVLKDTTIFTEDDFNVPKIIRAVLKQGDPQASDFANTLKGDDYEINRLIAYLNRFTREVVQRCADISSESTKSVFVQLRKDLKKQGKNLTLFVEDFTGFTGIDSELITVLSTEHGGDYADLCRVTTIIGITDYYYDQFKGNFTDRVTHQISVTDRSYGTDDFLVQMAGRYINAIYCHPDVIHQWNESGADITNIPTSEFTVPFKWESVAIEGKEVALYPFNSRSLLRLYESLPEKSPRMFLKDVIRAQLKEFFDGKQYGDNWYFPMNPANVQMTRATHSSAIDRLDAFSMEDKNRIKAVLALWGDGSADGLREADGTITFGGVSKAFFDDIGLEAFAGIGELTDRSTGKTVKPDRRDSSDDYGGEKPDKPITSTQHTKRNNPVDATTKNYLKHRDDINDWFTKNEPLKFDPDYRDWLRTLVKGEPNQSGAINWQDMGIPAYIAEERLADLAGYYIDDQKTPTRVDRAMVYMDKSVESRDALLALNEFNYAGGWEFDGAAYYQQRLITWLERRKVQIIEKVTATKAGEPALPVLQWCLTLQYLKACILGQKLDMSSPYSAIRSLFSEFKRDNNIRRETREWNDLVQFVENKNAEFESALTFLRCASATTMGAVHYSVDAKTKSCLRMDELVAAVEKLMEANWDIENELPDNLPSNHLLFNYAVLLKNLYPNIRKVMKADTEHASSAIKKLSGYVGEVNQDNLLVMLTAIQELFTVFSANSVIGSNELRTKYDRPPIDTAKEILEHISVLTDASSTSPVMQLTAYSGNALNSLADYLRDFQAIAQKAEKEEAKANKEVEQTGSFLGLEQMTEAALMSMDELCRRLEEMEVYNDAAD